MLIKDAEKMVFMGRAITCKRAQDSFSLVSKGSSKEHPEYLQQVPQTKVGILRLQVYSHGY